MFMFILACATPDPAPPGGSGGALQDPTGFPKFHDMPPPDGPKPEPGTAATPPISLGKAFRPQIEVGPDDTLHAVYYDDNDIVRYRTSRDGQTWSEPEAVSPLTGRNWGPDLVVRKDSVLVSYDHIESDFSGRTWLRERTTTWSEPVPLTDGGARESGSGHIAGDLAFAWIGKRLGPEHTFVAYWRWRTDGAWSEPVAWTDGKADAWHTNVMARPDGSLLAGWDVGAGQSETRVFVAEGRNGAFSPAEDITATSRPGERVHFAFAPDRDWLTWFHKEGGRPLHVYVRSGKPHAWGETLDLAKGYGGYHYDPFIAVNAAGVVCVVWGWDGGAEAELLYSFNRGSSWDPPRRAAALGKGKPELPSMSVDSSGRFHVVWAQGTRGDTQVWATALTP